MQDVDVPAAAPTCPPKAAAELIQPSTVAGEQAILEAVTSAAFLSPDAHDRVVASESSTLCEISANDKVKLLASVHPAQALQQWLQSSQLLFPPGQALREECEQLAGRQVGWRHCPLGVKQ